MASFTKVHEMLCLCLIEEIIDEEELFCFTKHTGRVIFPFPHSAYEKFSLANKDSAECNSDFRVEKRVIPLLLAALRVPPVRNGTICDGVEGLCIGWLHGHMSKTLLN